MKNQTDEIDDLIDLLNSNEPPKQTVNKVDQMIEKYSAQKLKNKELQKINDDLKSK